ncbi:MAG: folylpolyglutamate synthase/dihydrofolate synthase family protein [Bacteroidota bacterium]
MNYKQTLDYFYFQLPMFHRVGAAAYKADLNNTIAICNLLDNPQNSFKSIHIAGTNGKGSVSHMLAAILQESGYKTGLYTSPHLKDFRERIRINGKMISKKYVCDFTEQYKKDFDKIKPSFFEMTVGLAFDYFREQKVDVAVIETGLGGRLDSTNIITPILSIITNIGWDHANLLGNTLKKIATEKAGIIKRNITVIIGETQAETKNVFIAKARAEGGPVLFADNDFKAKLVNDRTLTDGTIEVNVFMKSYFNFRFFQKVQLDLTGHYQLKNICTVFDSIAFLESYFPMKLSKIFSALRKVKQLTGLRGRWEIISKNPLTICDTGHNADGIKEVLKQLKKIKYKQLHFVLGMVKDKDISGILKLLPRKAVYYFCKAKIPRGMNVEELLQLATISGLTGKAFSSVRKALWAAQKAAAKNDLIFVGGSTFTVAEVL